MTEENINPEEDLDDGLEPTIKIIRLTTGEDIISFCIFNDKSIVLFHPMTVFFKRTSKGSALMMTPWLPFELIDANITEISYADVLTVMNAKDEISIYYQKTLKNESKLFEEYTNVLLEKVRDYISDDPDSESTEGVTEESAKTEPVSTPKKHTLH